VGVPQPFQMLANSRECTLIEHRKQVHNSTWW